MDALNSDVMSLVSVTDEGLKWLQGVHTISLWRTKVTEEGKSFLRETGTVKIYEL